MVIAGNIGNTSRAGNMYLYRLVIAGNIADKHFYDHIDEK